MDATARAKGTLEMPKPILRSPDEMNRMITQLEKEGYDLKRLSAIGESVGDRKNLADRLKKMDPKLNGNVDGLIEDLGIYKVEIDRKHEWKEKKSAELPKGLLGRTWNRVKEFAKKHPIITSVAAIGLIAGAIATGLYMSGIITAAQVGVAAETIRSYFQASNRVNIGIGEMPGFNPLEGVPPLK